jgi:hypothetical protein
MSDRVELGIWTPGGDFMTVRAYLEAADAGEANWRPELEDSILFLEAGGREWLGSTWNLGALETIVAQLEAAADRLAERRRAIVRSAVDDQPIVPYLLWEPSDDRVAVTLFFIEGNELNFVYPPDDRLDDYVAEHRDRLVSGLPDHLRAEAFEGVSLPYGLMCASLRRETALGRSLLERCRGT